MISNMQQISVHFFANQFDASTDFEKIFESLQCKHLIQLKQIHSDIVVKITTENINDQHTGDAMITNTPGLALMIKTADCQALLVEDPVQKTVGAIHAGWRGLIQDIIPKTIKMMKENYGSNPADLKCTFIPSLLPCCSEFSDPYNEIPKKYHDFVLENNHVDLPGIVDKQLRDLGVPQENMERMAGCTKCESEKFFSHRRGDKERMGSVIQLVS